MLTHRNALIRALAEIDGVIVEAKSHVEKPGDDTESPADAARVLADMELARRKVEGELRGRMSESVKRKWLRAALLSALYGFAFGGGLLATHATLGMAIAGGILIAIISGSLIGLTVLFERKNWRFSLRTLLIATTLVAVVLGLAVYAARK